MVKPFPNDYYEILDKVGSVFNTIVDIMADEAGKKASERRAYEDRISWDGEVLKCMLMYHKRKEKYRLGMSRYWRHEVASEFSERYIEGLIEYCLSLRAAYRSHLYDYAMVLGAPITVFYKELRKIFYDECKYMNMNSVRARLYIININDLDNNIYRGFEESMRSFCRLMLTAENTYLKEKE